MPDRDSHVGHERAIADYLESSNFARTAAQFTFGANGGAAAAVLSFITTTVNSAVKTDFDRRLIVHNFSIGCSFYVAGLLVAAFSMYFFARSKKLWGDAWEDAAFTGNIDFKGHFAVTAQKRENVAWLALILSGVMLAVGSFFRYPSSSANDSTESMTGGMLLLQADTGPLAAAPHCLFFGKNGRVPRVSPWAIIVRSLRELEAARRVRGS